jgi:cation transport ATPase
MVQIIFDGCRESRLQIDQMVSDASRSRAPIQNLVDKVGQIFRADCSRNFCCLLYLVAIWPELKISLHL